MNHMIHGAWLAIVAAGCVGLVQPAPARADDLPTRGMPVPELQVFDNAMQIFMAQRGIETGLLGIMNNGCIVYERAFGWLDEAHTETLPEDAMMRIASCGKPVTAAAVRKLAAIGAISLDDHVFDLGQTDPPGPGILDYEAFPTLRDGRVADIRVQHLIDHQSGWDRSTDPTRSEVGIALAFRVPSPPGRILTARYGMGMEMQVEPGTPPCDGTTVPPACYPGDQYGNFGYMLLGLIVEQESGMDYIDFVREYVFGPIPGEPGTDVELGRTFKADQNPREPWYDDDAWATNVFDPLGPPVRRPYGGWDHEARVAQGGLIAATEPLLRFLEYYKTDGSVIVGGPVWGKHTGSQPGGTRALVRQRDDGIYYVVLFNRKEPGDGGGLCADLTTPCGDDADCPQGQCFTSWADQVQILLDDVIDNTPIAWPTLCVDGTWVDFSYPFRGKGNFDKPFRTLDLGLANTPEQARVQIKSSSTNWTGVIAQAVELRAPLGSVIIGR